MKNRLVQRALITATVAAACALAGAVQAQALTKPVSEGSFSFAGDQGEYITGGASHSFTPQDGLTIDGTRDETTVFLHTSSNWSVDLRRLDSQPLTVGTYVSDGTPGTASVRFGGPERHCDRGTGQFTITDIVWGANGYVQKLDATFEFRCLNATAAVRGEVHVDNPVGPTPQEITATISPAGTYDPPSGAAVINGTVTCATSGKVGLRGQVTQDAGASRGTYSTSVDCTPGAPVAWTASVRPEFSAPFHAGAADVITLYSAWDDWYQNSLVGRQDAVVQLAA